MSAMVRCPNPACPQVFPGASMVPGTRYQCPGCGTQFAFQPVAPSQPTQATSPANIQSPVQGSLVQNSPGPSSPDSGSPGSEAANPPGGIPDHFYKPALMALVGILLAAFVILVGFKLWEQNKQSKMDKVPGGNFQVVRRESLKRDEGLELEVQSDLVYSEIQGDGTYCFAARDFKDRLPTTREMVETALEKLRKRFPEKVEFEKRSEGDETIDGIPFSAYEFVGKGVDGQDYAGEFHLGAANGFGYFLLGWGKLEAKESGKSRRKEIRQGFSQLDLRADWKPEGTKSQVIEGKGWQLQLNSRLWSQQEIPDDLKETNPKAVVRLEGKIPNRKFFAGEMAEGYVVVLDEGADAAQGMTLAKEYILRMEKPVDDTKLTLELTTNQDGEEIDRKVESKGAPQVQQLLRLIASGESQRVFLVQAGVFQKKTIFLFVSCATSSRKLWEEELFKLADGLIIESP